MSFLTKLRMYALAAAATIAAVYPAATVAAVASRVHELMVGLLFGPQNPLQAGRVNGALTLTSLIPTIYAAMDVVSREMTGFIRAVSTDAAATRAAVGETIMSPVVGAMAAENLTASNVPADTPNQTIGNVPMTISKARSVPFGITGEEARGLQNAGTLDTINRDRIAQALRTLGNEVENDLAALYAKASRAFGTAAGTPFGTGGDLSDFAAMRRMLTDNGAPQSDLHAVLSNTNVERIRGKQSSLFRVNEAGSDELLRTGNMGVVQSMALHESAQIYRPAVGTGSAYTSNTAGYAVGATNITLITGANTILAGDIVTFAGDANQYVVKTGLAAPGVLVLAEPGLQQALPASAVALSIVAQTRRSMFFHRSAIQLLTRAPAMPPGGDMADDVMVITDPVTGIGYEFVIYRGKRQIRYEVNLAWGTEMIAPRHCGLLIGA